MRIRSPTPTREEDPPKQLNAETFPPRPPAAKETDSQTEKGNGNCNLNKIQRGAKRWMKDPPWKGGKAKGKGKQKNNNQLKGKDFWIQKGKAKGTWKK